MALGLSEHWWMGLLVALTGGVLLGLNVRALPQGQWTVSILSTASAAFVAVLGLALVVERSNRTSDR